MARLRNVGFRLRVDVARNVAVLNGGEPRNSESCVFPGAVPLALRLLL